MKFINLLKKELRELITLQTIITMFASLIILFALGNVMGGVMEDAMKTSDITICDQDNTEFTKGIISDLEKDGNKVTKVDLPEGDYAQQMKSLKVESLIVFPKGFTEKILTDNKQTDLEIINVLKSTSLSGTLGSAKTTDVIDTINDAVANSLMKDNYKLTEDSIKVIKDPVNLKEITVANDKSAEVSSTIVASLSMSQGIIIPIVIFILILFASQMIMSAISTEKIDKTLETLLSAPVSRLSVLTAKMLAATIVAILNAVVYMIGFSSYMGSMMGGTISGATNGVANSIGSVTDSMNVASALQTLGLQMSPSGFVLVGLQMFMTIMIALSISLILGAMANDVKSSQTLLMPIMFLTMIPYLISMFTSINELPTVFKVIIYLIPFTHTFTAIDNIIFGNMTIYWIGLIYQIIAFAVCLFLAVRLFTSDKIFTISLNLGQKKNFSKGLFAKK